MWLCRLFFRSSGIFARRQTFMTPSCCCFTSPQKQLEEYLLIQSRGILEFYMNNMACRSWRTMSHGIVGFHSNHIHFKPLRHSSSLWGAALAWPWHAFSASICAPNINSKPVYHFIFYWYCQLRKENRNLIDILMFADIQKGHRVAPHMIISNYLFSFLPFLIELAIYCL